MKKILTTLFLFFALPSILFAGASATVIGDKVDGKSTQVLFVLLSKEASVRATDKPGTYKLTLKGVNPKVVYFSNRPQRISGQLSINKFVSQWIGNGVFSKIAPNAAIEAVSLNPHTNKLTNSATRYEVVLDKPAYAVNSKNEISFQIKALPEKNMTLPELGKSDYVAIFIDDVCLSCIG